MRDLQIFRVSPLEITSLSTGKSDDGVATFRLQMSWTNNHVHLPRLPYFITNEKDITVNISQFLRITGTINRTLKQS